MDGQVLVQGKSRWTDVRCPGCGNRRTVSSRQAHRQEIGESSGLCRRCRNPPRMIHDEDDPRLERIRLWWLEQAGIKDLQGLDARSYVRAFGCPPCLVEIAESIGDWLDP